MAPIRLVHRAEAERVDVLANDALFTVYRYPTDEPVLQKPVLAPINTAKGTPVTRGFPLAPRAGERTDHPHHIGAFLTYGEEPGVNGVGFWNVSDSLDADETRYGRIVHQEIISMEEQDSTATLNVRLSWERGDGLQLLEERASFRFHADAERRVIDRVSELRALDRPVSFPDDKEGFMALRVARELDHPDEVVGAPDQIVGPDGSAVDANDASHGPGTGEYLSAARVRGTAVWGTRARWVRLSGSLGSTEPVTVTVMDHPANPGYPTYWHARGYGLFAANPLGQAVFSNGEERFDFNIPAGESATFRYRIAVDQGTPSPAALDQRQAAFAAETA